MELSAKTLWPLFPLLLLVVAVCLTWAFVAVVRQSREKRMIWVQGAALLFYLLAAASAIASEGGGMSANVHRPFSILTQVMIVVSIVFNVGKKFESGDTQCDRVGSYLRRYSSALCHCSVEEDEGMRKRNALEGSRLSCLRIEAECFEVRKNGQYRLDIGATDLSLAASLPVPAFVALF